MEERPANSLRLTPGGHLRPFRDSGGDVSPAVQKILEEFSDDAAAGLFALAARQMSGGLPPHLAYWKELASRCLVARCRTPVGAASLEPLDPLPDADAGALLAAAPPMPGAEYLDAAVLQGIWRGLDDWVIGEARRAGGLEPFLKSRAPLWRHVGRVCFHLAENRKDPDYPFAFMATYAPRLSDSTRIRYQPLSLALTELAGERNRKALVNLLTPISRAAEKSALIRDLVDTNDIYHPLAWTKADAWSFLQEVPLYEESGLLVRLPDWWSRRPRPQVAVRIGTKSSGILGGESLLDFRVEAALGEERLTPAELASLLAGEDGLVMLKGRWVEVDREKLSQALEHWRRVEKGRFSDGISFVEGMRLLSGAPAEMGAAEVDDAARGWSFVDAGPWLKDLLARLRSPEGITARLPGGGLHGELRPYQEAGVKWLWLLSGLGLGACLADDMGLGKTVQVITVLLMMKKAGSGPALLVLPASLMANWKAELERFAPSLKVKYFHPSMGAADGAADGGGLRGVDVAITTYGMLARTPELEEREWALVVLDEAQAIKNAGARQTRAVKRLKAHARIALTGTPVENRLSDLWSLFDFLSPGLLGSLPRFKIFVKSLESGDGERYAPLRSLVRPYILRRLKTDKSVISDLPEKTVVPAFCALTRAQAALYKRTVDELADALADSEGIARRGLILSSILKLKQVCNHPSQLKGDGEWDAADSGKFIRLGELAEEISSRQDRVLVFTQFREMTEPLAQFLAGVFGRSGLVLHGGTPVKERKRIVDAFQAEDGPPFFILSLKAGGTGLNLTAASHVIHFDRWWNPAVENQATDRAYRIGQKRNVLVHTFVCQGTVEEKIDALIREKTALASDILGGGGERMLTEMGDQELLATVALDIERASGGE